jgi:hypothetical protein
MSNFSSEGNVLDVIERVFNNHKIYVDIDFSPKGKVLKCTFEEDNEVYRNQEIFEFLANDVLVDLSLCTREQLQRINEFTQEKYGKVYFDDECIKSLEEII